jgi:hypothetical protein
MDVSCPSRPPNILIADKVSPTEQTTTDMAAHGCHFIRCCLYVVVIIIEVLLSCCAELDPAQAVLYKTGPLILSSTFFKK